MRLFSSAWSRGIVLSAFLALLLVIVWEVDLVPTLRDQWFIQTSSRHHRVAVEAAMKTSGWFPKGAFGKREDQYSDRYSAILSEVQETSLLAPRDADATYRLLASTHQVGGILIVRVAVVDDLATVRRAVFCPDGRSDIQVYEQDATEFLATLSRGRFWRSGSPFARLRQYEQGLPWRMWLAEGREGDHYQLIEPSNAGSAAVGVIDSAFLDIAGIENFRKEIGACQLTTG